nr:hypothetical protein [Tanacetum cinerariifolium]
MAFVSEESTNSTNELNAAYSVSTTTCHSSQAQSSSSYADELMFMFFANQSSTPQLDKEDLEQINQDDLKEMDLKWQVVCFNCHRIGHFTRDCRSARNSWNRSRDAENTGYRGKYNGKRPVKEEDENAMIVQDGLGTYDWSYQVEEKATDFALMDFTSNHSSSSSSNSEVQSCSKQCEQSYKQLKTLFDKHREKLSKANIEIIGYQYGLESIQGQLHVHQQNEVIYKEKIRVLEHQVKDKSNLLKYTQKQLDESLKEKEDLKVKLEKFETSSKNFTKLLDSQISAKVKTGLEYDSQFNEKEVLNRKEEEVTETMFDNRSSDEENSVANDRFKKGEGYHAVPPPLTGNYMPPKPDLSFAELYDSIYKVKISETVTSLAKDENDAPKTSTACVEKPKVDRSNAHLIEDLKTNSDDDNVFTPEPIPAKIDFVKAGKGTGHKESRPVWNDVQRINHQNNFAPIAVFTRSGRIPVSVAKLKAAASTSAGKPVNTAGPKPSVNFSRTKNSDVKGNEVTAIKTSAGCVWRPRGHQQQALKNKGIVESGCSRHITGNKAYLLGSEI